MSEAFPEFSVDELTSAQKGAMKIGPFGSQLRKEEMVEHGFKVYGQENVISGDWTAGDRRVSQSKFRALSSCELVPGDLVVSMMGTAGKCAVFPSDAERGIMDSHLLRIQPNLALVNRDYFARALQAESVIGRQVAAMSHGSIMAGLSSKIVKTFKVPLPPLREQPQISEVLQTLDTAIVETEAIIAKLKAVKQGLLHDLLTRGIDANGELRPPQPEAPHLYKESPLGWIPKEWTFDALSAWFDGKPKNGYSPQEAGAWTGIQMLGLGCLTSDGFQPVQLKPAPRGDRKLQSVLLSEGDLLISRANTRDLVGSVGVYRDVGTPCTYPDLMMRLRPSTDVSSEFLEIVLQSPGSRRQIQAHAVGTSESMVKISGKIVSNLQAAMPGGEEQGAALRRLASAKDRIGAESEKVALLRQLKSGLMDDLLTGRVRVTPLLEPATP